jgi:hypothetical protein
VLRDILSWHKSVWGVSGRNGISYLVGPGADVGMESAGGGWPYQSSVPLTLPAMEGMPKVVGVDSCSLLSNVRHASIVARQNQSFL